jgi:hydroxylaminobenzene mutase
MKKDEIMDRSELIKRQSDQLVFWGVFLFFLGLIIGLIAPALANPRMGLSSHIEGVLNGMFLIILGLIWNRVNLSERWLKITFWLAVYGTFTNWLGMLIAAIFNAGKMLGIEANGKEGHPIVEAIITFSLISLSIAMLTICITIMIGLRRKG